MDSFFSLLLLAIVSFATFLNVLVVLYSREGQEEGEKKRKHKTCQVYTIGLFFSSSFEPCGEKELL